jgi:serpin B
MFKRMVLTFLGIVTLLLAGSGVMAQSDDALTAELVAGNNDFAFRLYQVIQAEEDTNLLIAPYSISQALAMTYAGARGETESQIAEVMGFTLPQDTLHPIFSALNTDLIARGNSAPEELLEFMPDTPLPVLSVANAFWGEQTFPFRQDYIDQMASIYGAGLQLTDFINQPEEARLAINQWVEDNTQHRIKDIVPPGLITPNTRLALANAIYFKGFWMIPFHESNTTDRTFFLLDGSTVTVPTMYGGAGNAYYSGEGYQGIELPYTFGNFSMFILMPDEGTFETFEDSLTAEKFYTILAEPQFPQVDLYLPKFTFEYDVTLSQTLQDMGMTDAFDPLVADFSGMAEVSPDNPLWISQVLHKTFIGVDEYGTEAAGATVVLGLGGGGPVESIELKIDHPFIFLIGDRQSGSILFIGRVLNPAAE